MRAVFRDEESDQIIMPLPSSMEKFTSNPESEPTIRRYGIVKVENLLEAVGLLRHL